MMTIRDGVVVSFAEIGKTRRRVPNYRVADGTDERAGRFHSRGLNEALMRFPRILVTFSAALCRVCFCPWEIKKAPRQTRTRDGDGIGGRRATRVCYVRVVSFTCDRNNDDQTVSAIDAI